MAAEGSKHSQPSAAVKLPSSVHHLTPVLVPSTQRIWPTQKVGGTPRLDSQLVGAPATKVFVENNILFLGFDHSASLTVSIYCRPFLHM